MITRNTLFGTSLSLAMITLAHGEMSFQSVSLTAEAYCENTEDVASTSESVLVKYGNNLTAECGQTMVSAYFKPSKGRFSMGAGSTGPSTQPQSGEGRMLTDNSMGYAAVEVEFEIDAITYFTMSRQREGAEVEIWQGDNLIHFFHQADDCGALLPGKYQIKMENNPFESPAWAELSFEQASGVAGDIDNNGVLDERDVVEMLKKIREIPSLEAKSKSGNTPQLAEKKRRPRCGNDFPQSNSRPQNSLGKPHASKDRSDSRPAVEAGGNKKRPSWLDATPVEKLPPNCAGDERSNSINAADAKAKPAKNSKGDTENAISIGRVQGDMNGDGQITIEDLAELLSQL